VDPVVRIQRPGPSGLVARVALSRPEVHNAFDPALIEALRSMFADLGREPAEALRVVVLSGDGRSFCAGADLAWMRASLALDAAENEREALAMAAMFAAIDTCPAPVIVRAHGATLGGGMGLCAVGDVVIAEAGTVFGFSETRLGLLPSVIAPYVIAKIGATHARALFPSGRRFDAARALRIGLIHEVAEGESALDDAVDGAVADVLAAAPGAARAAKTLVRDVRDLSPDAARTLTARLIAAQRTSPEAQEGIGAFLEKRRPAWRTDADG
jgi:methylglutaconyl-CoA hydratase